MTKAKPTQKHIQRCFPALREYDFDAGVRWLTDNRDNPYFFLVGGVDRLDGGPQEVHDNLQKLKNFLRLMQTHASSSRSNSNHSAAQLGFPPIMVKTTAMGEQVWFERYYDRMRKDMFRFDDQACCNASMQPYEDEHVFHHRGFAFEMPKEYKKMGFEELSPKLIATELFGHLQPGDKVAILGRFVHSEPTQQIVAELQARGIQVRTIGDGDAMHDFCFLKNAKKELVGMWKSTFVRWAFLLSDSVKMARFYTYDSPINRQYYGDTVVKVANTTFTHPALASRYRFEVYTS
ncbi:MAG: hypothetical protein SGILL_008949 [Bacillariaceae sp.]